ncbi:MAG: UDP-N-acetylmuramate dehydrogenase [Gammaproteobacteria bacterium]
MNAAFEQHREPRVRGRCRRNEALARHSTWRCGGPAAYYFEPVDRDDLVDFIAQMGADLELLWLGLGSNLLVRDGGVQAAVIATSSHLNAMHWPAPDRLYADCGVTCARLAREAARQDREGLEFLAGIPGTLGGALRMNAGALGSEMWSFVHSVETIDASGHIRSHPAAEFEPRYRGVEGPAGWFLGATLALPDHAGGRGHQRIREVLAQRSATQPTGQASCGSVFKNPPGDFAGRLIEQCGLKGYRVGGCQVSTMHANFIVNDDAASAADIESLIGHIRAVVAATTGIELETEVQIVGQHAPHAPGGAA